MLCQRFQGVKWFVFFILLVFIVQDRAPLSSARWWTYVFFRLIIVLIVRVFLFWIVVDDVPKRAGLSCLSAGASLSKGVPDASSGFIFCHGLSVAERLRGNISDH